MRDGSTPQLARILPLRDVSVFAAVARRSLVNRIRIHNEVKRLILANVKDGEYFAFEVDPDNIFRLLRMPAMFVPDAAGDEDVWVIRDIMTGEEELLTDPGLPLEEMPQAFLVGVGSAVVNGVAGLGGLLMDIGSAPSRAADKGQQLKRELADQWDKATNWEKHFP